MGRSGRRFFLVLALCAALLPVASAQALTKVKIFERPQSARPLGKWSLVNRKVEAPPDSDITVSFLFRPEIDVPAPIVTTWRQYQPSPPAGSTTNCLKGPFPICPPEVTYLPDLNAGLQYQIDLQYHTPPQTTDIRQRDTLLYFPNGVIRNGFRINVEIRESDPDDPTLPKAKGRRASYSFVLTVNNPTPKCPDGKLCINPVR